MNTKTSLISVPEGLCRSKLSKAESNGLLALLEAEKVRKFSTLLCTVADAKGDRPLMYASESHHGVLLDAEVGVTHVSMDDPDDLDTMRITHLYHTDRMLPSFTDAFKFLDLLSFLGVNCGKMLYCFGAEGLNRIAQLYSPWKDANGLQVATDAPPVVDLTYSMVRTGTLGMEARSRIGRESLYHQVYGYTSLASDHLEAYRAAEVRGTGQAGDAVSSQSCLVQDHLEPIKVKLPVPTRLCHMAMLKLILLRNGRVNV